MKSKKEFLAELPLFKELNEDALEKLANISDEYSYEKGAVIAYQRDVANSLFIVKSGRLFAKSVDKNGLTRDTRSYMPKDCFKDKWLFVPDVHPATVTGAEDGHVIIIEGSKFLHFLQSDFSIVKQLEPDVDVDDNETGLSDEAWREAEKVRLREKNKNTDISLLPDELIEYYSHRSGWYLFLRLIFPVILTLVIPPLLFVFMPDSGLLSSLKVVLPALLVILGLALIAFRILDWRNDYFVVTNKHLTHHEFELRHFRVYLVKIPINQIQSVEILKPSFMANLFNIGTARVTTAAAAGTILFDNIDDPGVVRETISRLTGIVRTLDAGEAQANMRRSVESHFNADPYLQPVDISAPENLPKAEVSSRLRFLGSFGRRYAWRDEQNGVVTYRKNFFILIREIAWPALGLFILLLSGSLYIRFTSFSISWFLAIFPFLLFLDLFWMLWEIEDWRNDIYQLTNRYVIDIDRQPFGFGESRKQATLDNIQNVNAEQPGFLATLFNYGNVIIETAGAAADIAFENVPHPSVIQRDIFQRLDEFRQNQRRQEGDRRREEYAVLIDVYKQATEKNRIPQRTPKE